MMVSAPPTPKEKRKQNLFVGIDIGKDSHYWCCLSSELLKKHGDRYYKCPHDKISINRGSFERFLSRLQELAHGGTIHVLAEHTGHYGYTLQEFLQERGVRLYRTQASRYNKDKTDIKDAEGLAVRLYNQMSLGARVTNPAERVVRLLPPKEEAIELYPLVRRSIDLTHAITAHKNRLGAIIDQLFPEFVQAIKAHHSPTGLNLRERFPTPEAIAAASLSELLATRIHGKPTNAAYARLQDLARTSIGLKEGIRRRSLVFEQAQLIEHLRLLYAQEKVLDQKIEQILLRTREGQILLSIPGIGVSTAGQLVAAIGNIANFETIGRFRAYLGWSPKQTKSGRSRNKEEMDRSGNRLGKIALRQATVNIINHSPRYHALSVRLEVRIGKKKTKGHVAGQVARLIYRLLVQDAALVRSYRGREDLLPTPVLYDEQHGS